MKVAIIGGGIAGLTAAFTVEKLRSDGESCEYELFEAGPRLGGVIRTEVLEDGSVLEAGPDSFITEKPWAADLCRELGIGDRLIGSNDAQRKTFILVNGRLVPLPDGLMFLIPTKVLPMVFTPLFSWPTKMRMAGELLFPPKPHEGDESVASFVTRHFGRQAVERLADPLLAGIYGGSAEHLSVKAVLPRMLDLEQKHGSLIRGMLAGRKQMAQRPPADTAPRPLFTSLRDGMQEMVDAVVARLNASRMHCKSPVEALDRDGDQWIVTVAGRNSRFNAVILALPSYAAGALLAKVDSRLATELEQIQYSSSITVNLVYDTATLPRLEGFGFLVPRIEGRNLLAVTYTHNKFPHRAGPGKSLLRCFFGGESASQVLALDDGAVAEMAQHDVEQVLGFRTAPVTTRVNRWNRAMAQYGVGHLARVAEIERLRRQLPGLGLAGNAYRGIGVPDAIRTGADAAREVTKVSQPATSGRV